MNSSIRRLGNIESAELEKELGNLPRGAWITHPAALAGLESIMLVSVAGTDCLDLAITGPVKATRHLVISPCIQSLIGCLGVPVSRARLMRLPSGLATGSPQARESYYWFRRSLSLIPIRTDRCVKAIVEGGHRSHVEIGRMLLVRNPYSLRMENGGASDAIHLVIEFGTRYFNHVSKYGEEVRDAVAVAPGGCSSVGVECYVFEVLSPPEVIFLTEEMVSQFRELPIRDFELDELTRNVDEFRAKWTATFEKFGHSSKGELAYRDLIQYFRRYVGDWMEARVRGQTAVSHLIRVISSMFETNSLAYGKGMFSRSLINRKAASVERVYDATERPTPEFDRPVFIVSAPRAGSTLLFESMIKVKDVWSIVEESHEVIEQISDLHPASRHFESNRLLAADATPSVVGALRERFVSRLRNFKGQMYVDLPCAEARSSIRVLEKTPKNSLRVPFLKAVFPTALFIFLVRDADTNIASLVEGWRSGQFVSYRRLPDWPYESWSFLLPPGWQSMHACSIADIAAYQWEQANLHILNDLECLPLNTWRIVSYADLIDNPKTVIGELCEFADMDLEGNIDLRASDTLPLSSRTLSLPDREKYKKVAHEFDSLRDRLLKVQHKILATQKLQRSAMAS